MEKEIIKQENAPYIHNELKFFTGSCLIHIHLNFFATICFSQSYLDRKMQSSALNNNKDNNMCSSMVCLGFAADKNGKRQVFAHSFGLPCQRTFMFVIRLFGFILCDFKINECRHLSKGQVELSFVVVVGGMFSYAPQMTS